MQADVLILDITDAESEPYLDISYHSEEGKRSDEEKKEETTS